jgi:HTH-type transcriptional regulator / antitoxin HipB
MLDKIAAAVKTERKRQKLTQADLALACNTGIRFIVELEAAKPTLQIGKVLHVVKRLGMDVVIISGAQV